MRLAILCKLLVSCLLANTAKAQAEGGLTGAEVRTSSVRVAISAIEKQRQEAVMLLTAHHRWMPISYERLVFLRTADLPNGIANAGAGLILRSGQDLSSGPASPCYLKAPTKYMLSGLHGFARQKTSPDLSGFVALGFSLITGKEIVVPNNPVEEWRR